MKIAIIGGGISGCTSYLMLKKHLPPPSTPGEEHSITIYEAYDTDKDTAYTDRDPKIGHSSTLMVGGGLAVGPNGMHVLNRLDDDLVKDIVRRGYPLNISHIKTKHGSLLMALSTVEDTPSHEVLGMHMVGSSRHNLWQCLRMRIPDEAIVTKRVTKVVTSSEGRNHIYFNDDSDPIEADLVIGADGVKGVVKQALFPDSDDDQYLPHYEGLVGVGGFIPTEQVKHLVQPGTANFILGGNGFFGYFFSTSAESEEYREQPYFVHKPGDTLTWWSTYSVDECPDPATLDKEAVAKQLRDRHASWGDPVIQKILGSLQVDNIYPTWTSPQLPTWERDGVVLVGDAAHALPPSSGQGSSQAFEDVESFVLFLSHQLQKQKPADDPVSLKHAISTAAKRYMELRRPRIQAILDDARRRQDSKRDMGWFAEALMYGFMWILGCFPGFASRLPRQVFNYNIAEEVQRAIAQED